MMGSWVRAPVGSHFLSFLLILDSIAQLVEHITFNDGVLGSSPSRVTRSRALCSTFLLFRPRGEIGRLASLRGWCSQGRVGSNPIVVTLLHSKTFKTPQNIGFTGFFISQYSQKRHIKVFHSGYNSGYLLFERLSTPIFL